MNLTQKNLFWHKDCKMFLAVQAIHNGKEQLKKFPNLKEE